MMYLLLDIQFLFYHTKVDINQDNMITRINFQFDKE